MGLLSSAAAASSSAADGKPSLEISIDRPLKGSEPAYTAGSFIHGAIRLAQCPPDGHRGDMVVSLSGLSKTKIVVSTGQSSVTYRGRAPLLNSHQPISDSTITPAGAPEWRFCIAVPDHCMLESLPPVHHTLSNNSSYFHSQWPGKAPYDVAPGQALPPSFLDNLNYGLYRAGNHITYMVIAELHLKDPKTPFIHARHPVLITRGPPSKPPPPEFTQASLTIRSPLLLPENAERTKLSFREKTSALFSSSKQPTFTFLWRATTPAHAAHGAPLQLDLALTPHPGPSDAPTPDAVHVEGLSVRARRHFFWRAPRDDKHYVERHVDSTREFRHDLPAGTVPPLRAESGWATTAHTAPFTVAGPSFATFNMVRAYDLEVEWTLRCAGEKHTLKSVAAGVDVHATQASMGGAGGVVSVADRVHADTAASARSRVEQYLDQDADEELSAPPTPPSYDVAEVSAAAGAAAAVPPPVYEEGSVDVGVGGDTKRLDK